MNRILFYFFEFYLTHPRFPNIVIHLSSLKQNHKTKNINIQAIGFGDILAVFKIYHRIFNFL
jgi:hypothetical protein